MSTHNGHDHEQEIVFFIDKEQFKTEQPALTVRELLEGFAHENPDETTLVLQKGNELTKFTDLNQSIPLHNGMKFVVFHNGPTPVS
jgi:hypothetical protein